MLERIFVSLFIGLIMTVIDYAFLKYFMRSKWPSKRIIRESVLGGILFTIATFIFY